VVSSTKEFDQPHFFNSYFFGPSSGTIELAPLSKNHEYKKWFGVNTKLYAIRLNNASSGMMMMNMLDMSLEETPILPYILGPPKAFQGTVLVKDIAKFENFILETFKEFDLNDGQHRAVHSFCKCLIGNQSPVVLVHGVYGAGKSHLLTVLIITLFRAFEAGLLISDTKVVFASLTNVAVDRILLGLLEMGFENFVRVGSIRKIAKPILPYTCHKSEANALKELETILETETLSVEEQEYVKKSIKNSENQQMLADAFLIGITTLATNFGIVQGIQAPIMILDECSQMTEPMSLLPMAVFKSSFTMCVGDPKQLPPTLSHSLDTKEGCGIETTLFERLANAGHTPFLLNTQYRCHPDIASISNQLFYENQLKTGISLDKRSPLVPNLGPISFVCVQGDEAKTGGSFTNSKEAKTITLLVKTLTDLGVEAQQIGVISLYKGQASFIQEQLKQYGISILCATVDSFQGAEMDVIIVSTVRTHRSEFLEDPRRINVAITRAKRHMILFASDLMVQESPLWSRMKSLCGRNVIDPNLFLHSLG
jgi:hypothetical protein